jgi:hypothetical protein
LSVRDEPVSLTGNGQDVVGVIRPLAEGPPEGRDLAGEVVFLNGRVRPDAIEQLVLGHKTIAMLEQDGEHVEGLGRNGYGVTVAPKPSRHHIGDERAERICTVPG